MKLPDLSIRRPVLTSMLAAALILFGGIGFTKLAVREFPDVDAPIVSVSVYLRGANPRVMESAVTDILEEELSTVPGLRTLTSSSAEENSYITLEFTLDRDIEAVAQDVREKVSRVRGRLPLEIEEPVIAKQSADAQPFFYLALSGKNYNLLQLSDIADRLVKQRLQTVKGVGQAQILGERRYAMRVWVSAAALTSRGLTVKDVQDAIRTRSVEIPAGRIESNRREFTVRSLGQLKTPAEFEDLTVSNQNGQLVKLRDVSSVELGPEDQRSVLRYDREPAIAIGVVRQSKSNLVEVADAIRDVLPEIQAALPPGVTIHQAFDQSIFVKQSIREAEETLLIAAALVVLIIFLFLRNIRATLIPGLAIPTSIIGVFAIMYFLHFSINNFTLLALTLAIGIVVDDAIIVLENAYRHQEELHEPPEEAASRGTSEIGFAVIATTISLVAVFTPLAFLQGTTGRLFNEFGIAVAGAVLISGFIALTLTPMLSAKILRVEHSHGRVYQALERALDWISSAYARVLARAVRHRWATVGASSLLIVVAVLVYHALKREFVPTDDRNYFPTIVVAPEGASLAYTDGYQRRVEDILAHTPEVQSSFSVIGFGGRVSQGIVFSNLTPKQERKRTVQQVVTDIQAQYMAIPGALIFANVPSSFGGFGNAVQFVVRNPNFDSLGVGMDTLVKRARRINGLTNVDTDLRVNKPELSVAFDRNRAEDLGVPVGDIASTLQTMLGGAKVSTFTQNDKLYYVLVQLKPEQRATPSDMSGIYVRGRDGTPVQLSAVTTTTEGVGPRQLSHFDRVRSFTLTAGLAPGFTLGEAIDSLSALAKEVLPRGSSIELAGESRELRESGSALYFAFGLALVAVFMVLASQFESLLHPFTVLLAVPLAVTGALITLLVAHSTINLYSQIGMVLLIGLVTKNSILLVEYGNQLRERGMTAAEAILESGRIRLRPILMTSVATIMGALPIALGLGAGAASRQPLGYAIVGGLFFSTLLTLFLVPAVYVILDGARVRLRRRAPELSPAEAD